MAFSEAIIVQVTRSVDTEFGQLSTQEQMTVDAIVQAR
jgi:E3 ubiquitin-protein ligase RGLG